ncbi:MAG TPA: helicase-exonuclease AddAB subunit AddA, partial [Lachnospiraceae bacterium]|nr:helicase-exonuclease AddAB subunit AddA [Lachnospiraceae bacterium]
ANTYSEVLSAHGIPNRSGSKTGYFSAPEVQTILAYLDILDNPRQDIPLAAVLRSEIGRLTDDELSMLKAGRRKDSLYDCVETFLSVYAHDRAEEQEDSGRSAGTGQKKTEQTDKGPSAQTSDRELGGGFQAQQEAALYEKLRQFREMTDRLRSHVSDTPIHQLLWQIYDETGFLAVSEVSEGGSQKRANLDMLVEKAIAYEQTSYRGLFHFVRYIDKLIRYEVDFGAALAENGSEDLVRIMTIHASKGLE